MDGNNYCLLYRQVDHHYHRSRWNKKRREKQGTSSAIINRRRRVAGQAGTSNARDDRQDRRVGRSVGRYRYRYRPDASWIFAVGRSVRLLNARALSTYLGGERTTSLPPAGRVGIWVSAGRVICPLPKVQNPAVCRWWLPIWLLLPVPPGRFLRTVWMCNYASAPRCILHTHTHQKTQTCQKPTPKKHLKRVKNHRPRCRQPRCIAAQRSGRQRINNSTPNAGRVTLGWPSARPCCGETCIVATHAMT